MNRGRSAQCRRLIGSSENVKRKVPVVIDTREQTPFRFDKDQVTPIHSTVPVFDYAVCFDPCSWAIERKSVADLVGSLCTKDGWRREMAKIDKARDRFIGLPLIYIVEGTVNDVLFYNYEQHEKVTAQFVFMRISQMIYRHNVHVIFAGSHAADFATLLLKRRHEDITGLESGVRRTRKENELATNDEDGSDPVYSEEGFRPEETDSGMVRQPET